MPGVSGLALVAECDKRVGSGHVVETSHLLQLLESVPHRVFLTSKTPLSLRRRFHSPVEIVPDLSPRSLSRIARRSRELGLTAVVLNALRVTPAMVRALKAGGLKIAGLSVSGQKAAGCDLWRTLGPGEMILSPEFARLARRPRRHRGPLREILILMGGTDSKGNTAAVVRALAGLRPELRKTVVVGPNFARPAELSRSLAAAKDASLRVVRDPKNLPALMRRADAALTLGSDTSLELACLGTPTLLFEEAAHERRQARLLARRGCGFFVGAKRDISAARILNGLARLDDAARRGRMARAGRAMVDGRGAERLAAALRRLSA
jgi:spore coat polysaccharide biosynthesis predicted glycosyltransferase SpsG